MAAAWWRRQLGSYDGRLMRCAPGTHEAAAAAVLRHVSTTARVLDLAAGTGAFLARLRHHGFGDLAAVELNVGGFDLPGVTPKRVDLNSPFDQALPHDLDLITAMEIVEHLDCPRAFVRRVHALLKPGGHLLLTTPNVAHWLGRVRFLLSGELRQFQRHDYDHQRHVSPTTHVQMRLMFEEVGFDLVEFTTAGTFFGPVKRAAFAPVTLLARLVLGPFADGDVAVYLVRKSSTSTPSSGRDSYYFTRTGA